MTGDPHKPDLSKVRLVEPAPREVKPEPSLKLTLKDLILRHAIAHAGRDFDGWEWDQLSTEERAVFGIDWGDFPLMLAVFHCFEAFTESFISVTDWTEDEDILDAARDTRPDIVEAGFSLKGFIAFATAFSSLTAQQAGRMWWKHQACLLRSGHLHFSDAAAS
jgi:hypothetical protein